MKHQSFQKVWILTFVRLVYQINSLHEALKLKRNFLETEIVTGNTPFFVLTFASDRAVFYGNFAFSILVLSNKKW